MVARRAWTTSSAADSGTSTSANRWWISIEPMSRPFRPVSPVMAPTRSPGRIPASRPAPTNSRAAGPPEDVAGRAVGATGAAAPGCAAAVLVRPEADLRDLLVVVDRSPGLVGELDRGEGDLHEVELVGERLDDDAEAVEVVPEQALPQGRAGQLEPPGAQVGDGRHLLDRDRRPGHPLDRLEHPVLARLGERDRDALAAGAADPADAVHVGLRRRRDVVVDDVGELLDVQAARRDVGGDQQVRRAPRAAGP